MPEPTESDVQVLSLDSSDCQAKNGSVQSEPTEKLIAFGLVTEILTVSAKEDPVEQVPPVSPPMPLNLSPVLEVESVPYMEMEVVHETFADPSLPEAEVC